jgi:hypothetical protein
MTCSDPVAVAAEAKEPPFGIDSHEAICPSCDLAFFVTEAAFSWGVCPDCLGEALVPVPKD